MAKLRFMGVEEAFNIPVKGCAAVEFVPAPGGTGAMVDALEASPPTADVCLALTECIVAAIEKGSPVRILGPYVTSPLVWGIWVRPGSEGQDLSSAVWGVSRLGSGSHVMVSVLSKKRGWAKPSFEVCGDFSGLRDALRARRVDAFMWEKFTTSPHAASGELRLAGEVPTPWGCFCAVVHPARVDVPAARRALDHVLASAAAFQQSTANEAARDIVDMSGMTHADAAAWHSAVRYAHAADAIDDKQLAFARDTVQDAGVIAEPKFADVREYCASPPRRL